MKSNEIIQQLQKDTSFMKSVFKYSQSFIDKSAISSKAHETASHFRGPPYNVDHSGLKSREGSVKRIKSLGSSSKSDRERKQREENSRSSEIRSLKEFSESSKLLKDRLGSDIVGELSASDLIKSKDN
jgi:hypothetical protein